MSWIKLKYGQCLVRGCAWPLKKVKDKIVCSKCGKENITLTKRELEKQDG